MNLSLGVVKTACSAMVNSTTPRFGPRWPPFFESLVISSCRISSASCNSWGGVSFFTCAGSSTISRYRLILLLLLFRQFGRGRFQHRFARAVLFQNLNLQFRVRQFGLAN